MDSAPTTRSEARRGRPSRAEQVEARRRALLDAAGVVFRRDGYIAASVDSIAEAAGLTKGAVYSNFTSKADLFLTLLEERITGRTAANAVAVEDAHDAETAKDFLLRANSITRDDTEWPLALLEFRIVAARDPELNARYARTHAIAVEGISRTLAALYEGLGITPPAPVEALARSCLVLEAGGVLEEIVAGHRAPEAFALEATARMLGLPPSS